MKDLLQKALSSTAGKIILCVIIAIPIWTIMMFANKEPEVQTPVIIVEEKQEETTDAKDNTTENEETTPTTPEEKTEITAEDLLKDLRIENNADSSFMSNSVFAIGKWVLKDDEAKNATFTDIRKLDDTIVAKAKQKYVMFEEKNVKVAHNLVIPISEDAICDTGTLNGYTYYNIYSKNEDGKMCVINIVLFASDELIVKTITEKIVPFLNDMEGINIDSIKNILRGE